MISLADFFWLNCRNTHQHKAALTKFMENTANQSITPFSPQYASNVSLLVHECIQHIDHPRYTQAHLDAWSTAPRSARHWRQRLLRSQSWLLLNNGPSQPEVIGVINVETDFNHRGYIDSLYISPGKQRQGLAGKLYQTLEQWAITQGYHALSVDASYLSKGFFLKQGFQQVQPSYQITKGQVINGFYMKKDLT